MTEDETAARLRNAYDAAPSRVKALHMMLFAVAHGEELKGHVAARLCEISGLPKWGPQLNLGRKLSEHVTLK